MVKITKSSGPWNPLYKIFVKTRLALIRLNSLKNKPIPALMILPNKHQTIPIVKNEALFQISYLAVLHDSSPCNPVYLIFSSLEIQRAQKKKQKKHSNMNTKSEP